MLSGAELALGFVYGMSFRDMLATTLIMFCAFLIAVLIRFAASMDSHSKGKDVDEVLIAWAERLQSRCLSVIRKHYKMVAIMGLLRYCGVFEGTTAKEVYKLVWVLYVISCKTDY
jgi:hypothetical protein